jgi:hypothetical protein
VKNCPSVSPYVNAHCASDLDKTKEKKEEAKDVAEARNR